MRDAVERQAARPEVAAEPTVPAPAATGSIKQRANRKTETSEATIVTATATKKFCSTCGAPVMPGVRFCSDCGTQI